ncbi:hypothetical protein [Paenibacillus sp. 1011MAR3C5]|nr:hypothetical protein [Paenibacillus sp. 1011MAR3C5]
MDLIQRYEHHLSTAREGLMNEISTLNEIKFNQLAQVDTWSISMD